MVTVPSKGLGSNAFRSKILLLSHSYMCGGMSVCTCAIHRDTDLDLTKQEEEVSASKEGNVVKFLSPPIAAIMNSTWHMSKTPLSLSWKASLFWKKKWEAEWNACEEVRAITELVFSETQHEHLFISTWHASTWTLFTKLRVSVKKFFSQMWISSSCLLITFTVWDLYIDFQGGQIIKINF